MFYNCALVTFNFSERREPGSTAAALLEIKAGLNNFVSFFAGGYET